MAFCDNPACELNQRDVTPDGTLRLPERSRVAEPACFSPPSMKEFRSIKYYSSEIGEFRLCDVCHRGVELVQAVCRGYNQ